MDFVENVFELRDAKSQSSEALNTTAYLQLTATSSARFGGDALHHESRIDSCGAADASAGLMQGATE